MQRASDSYRTPWQRPCRGGLLLWLHIACPPSAMPPASPSYRWVATPLHPYANALRGNLQGSSGCTLTSQAELAVACNILRHAHNGPSLDIRTAWRTATLHVGRSSNAEQSSLPKTSLLIGLQGGRVLEQGTHDELMAHRNGPYTQLVNHRQQAPEEAPAAAADDDIVLAPEPDEDTFAGKAAARRSMAIRSSMVAGRKSMAPGRKSMAPGRKSMAPGRKDVGAGRKSMAPGRQSIAPAGRKSVFPGRFLLTTQHALRAVKHACLLLFSLKCSRQSQ